MTNTAATAACFVGESSCDWETMKLAMGRSRIQIHIFSSIRHCQEWLSHEQCDFLVVDLEGSNAQGLDLITKQKQTPRIGLVDHGDISTTVQAIKAGATTCLEKPIDVKKLQSELKAILAIRIAPKSSRLSAPLTPTEKVVLHHILEGKTSAETGDILHRSQRTIEVHRRNLMRKLGASNIVDLVRSCMGVHL